MFITIKNKNDGEFKFLVKNTLPIIGIVFLTILLDYTMIKIIDKYIETIQNARLNLEIIENLSQILSGFILLFGKNLELFPKFLRSIITLIILAIIYLNSVKNKRMKEFYLAIMLLFICFGSCLVLGIVNKGLIFDTNGRVFTSLGSSISVLFVFMYVKTDIFDDKVLGKLILTLIILYFIANFINTMYTTGLLKQENNLDKEFSYEIKTNIEKYEEKTNKRITKFVICYVKDKERVFTYKRIRINMKEKGLYNGAVYEMYTGEKLERGYAEVDKIDELFKYNKLDMICEEDTIYIPI